MLFHRNYYTRKMEKMKKKLALLGVLVLVVAVTAGAASASGALQEIIVVSEEKEIPIDVILSVEEMAEAKTTALADARVQAMLKEADDYEIRRVYVDVNVKEAGVRVEDGKLIIPIEKVKTTAELVLIKEENGEFEKRVWVELEKEEKPIENWRILEIEPVDAKWISLENEAVEIEDETVEIGRNYLENVLLRGGSGPWVGDLLQVKLEVRDPNYYWYGYPWEGEVDRPEGESTLCWIITFEQAKHPGHWFEVWVDAESGDVVGGMQCR